MENLTNYLAERYNFYVYDQMDPRLKGYFLVDSALPFLLIVFSYVLFVKWIGPRWMRDRPPYNVDKVMLIYNIVQMAINSRFVYVAMTVVYLPQNDNIICVRLKSEPDAVDNMIINYSYLFLLSRLLDFLDTVFMVLKKNNHQVSFLHVYHHLMMATGGWFILKYYAGGNCVFLGTINSSVHVVMYFYYFLTAYNPSYKKSLWWKKRITQIQIGQFFLVLIQQMFAYFNGCELPKYIYFFYISQVVAMITLFSNFYIKSYTTKTKLS